jgi:DNA-directed RNA polymerase alpha subunit
MPDNDQTLQMRVLDDVTLTANTTNELRKVGLVSISQLISKSEKQLAAMNLSKTAILEVKDILGGMGLALAPD